MRPPAQGFASDAGRRIRESMTPDELQALPDAAALPLPLQALWRDARGQWDEAHELAQRANSREGDWVHAYLHRKEGDASNAAYWYGRARQPVFRGSLEEEWRQLAAALLRGPESEKS